jgi:hypothetical protein
MTVCWDVGELYISLPESAILLIQSSRGDPTTRVWIKSSHGGERRDGRGERAPCGLATSRVVSLCRNRCIEPALRCSTWLHLYPDPLRRAPAPPHPVPAYAHFLFSTDIVSYKVRSSSSLTTWLILGVRYRSS